MAIVTLSVGTLLELLLRLLKPKNRSNQDRYQCGNADMHQDCLLSQDAKTDLTSSRSRARAPGIPRCRWWNLFSDR